ncbi:hypothetical protein LINPERPRIM_LOCUS7115 [Linum perenne]
MQYRSGAAAGGVRRKSAAEAEPEQQRGRQRATEKLHHFRRRSSRGSPLPPIPIKIGSNRGGASNRRERRRSCDRHKSGGRWINVEEE